MSITKRSALLVMLTSTAMLAVSSACGLLTIDDTTSTGQISVSETAGTPGAPTTTDDPATTPETSITSGTETSIPTSMLPPPEPTTTSAAPVDCEDVPNNYAAIEASGECVPEVAKYFLIEVSRMLGDRLKDILRGCPGVPPLGVDDMLLQGRVNLVMVFHANFADIPEYECWTTEAAFEDTYEHANLSIVRILTENWTGIQVNCEISRTVEYYRIVTRDEDVIIRALCDEYHTWTDQVVECQQIPSCRE